MDIAYGIKVQETGDLYISLVEEVIDGLNKALVPGAFWVDFFPILVHVPSWFPSAGFQKKAAHWRELNKIVLEKPFRYVQEQLVRDPSPCVMNMVILVILQKIGSAVPSVLSTLIERLPNEDDPQRPTEEKVAQNVAAMSYIGLCSCKWIECIMDHLLIIFFPFQQLVLRL